MPRTNSSPLRRSVPTTDGYAPVDQLRASAESLGSGVVSDYRSPYGDSREVLRRHEEAKRAYDDYQRGNIA